MDGPHSDRRATTQLARSGPFAEPTGGGDPEGGGSILEGFTERYLRVRFEAPSEPARDRFPGTFQDVLVESAGEAEAWGRWRGGEP